MKIPDKGQLKTAIIELQILVDHQNLISVRNLRPNEIHYDRVRRWADFLSEYPESREKGIWTIILSIQSIRRKLMSADSTISKETLINSREGEGTVLREAQNRPQPLMNQCITERPRISVILPVWNPGPGIDRCIASLRCQTIQDIEMIFVDDRGTDDAMEKIQAAAAEDPRIRILENPENMGAGPSRNRGIEAAKGDFLSFIDPDDYIAPDFYERLYTKAISGDYDIAKGIRIKVDSESGDSSIQEMNDNIQKGLNRNIPLFVLFSSQHQAAIYKKELFYDKKVRYGKSRNEEDVTFLLTVCKKARNIIFDDDAVYYYSVRPGSQTAAFTEQRCRNDLESLSEKIDFLLSGNMDVFDYRYLSGKISYYISIICYAISVNSLSYEQETELVNFLRQQIIRIPDPNQIKKAKVELRILMDYQKLIPVSNLRPNEFHYDRVRRWVDFLSEHPEIKEKRIWTGFDFALVDVIFPKAKTSGKPYFFGRRYFSFMRKQIGRLTGRQRRLMLCYSSPALKRAKKIIYQLMRFGEK